MKDVFCRKKQITKNDFSWVFTERVTITLMSFHINKTVVSSKILSSDLIKNILISFFLKMNLRVLRVWNGMMVSN